MNSDKRIILAAAHNEGAALAHTWLDLPRPVRVTYDAATFGYLVGQVVARYSEVELAAFRTGFLTAMHEAEAESHALGVRHA